MKRQFWSLLGKIFLSKEARELGESLASSGITGAKVVGRGTIVCDAQVIAATPEFQRLKQQAKEIVKKDAPA